MIDGGLNFNMTESGIYLPSGIDDSTSDIFKTPEIVVKDEYVYFDPKLNYGLTQKQLEEQKQLAEFRQWILRNPVNAAEELFGIAMMDYQKYVFMSTWNAQFAVWCMSRNAGKALDINTPIPLAKGGFKNMKDIQIGDYVLGDDGLPTKVINTSPIFYDHKCYRVHFSDSTSIDCDEEHIWHVTTKNHHERNKYHDYNMTINEILKRGYKTIRKDGYYNYKYHVRLTNRIQYEEKKLLIHPYILGLWLGDGTSIQSAITAHINDVDEMVKNIKSVGYDIKSITNDKDTKRRISIVNEDGVPLITLIRKLGLYHAKDIPDDYMYSSVEQRMELIRGLMDTDGTASKEKNGDCEFAQKSYDFIHKFSIILNSLGIRNTISKHDVGLNGKIFKNHRCHFFSEKDFPCFRMRRKLDLLPSKNSFAKRKDMKAIINIEEIESVPTKCIYVDNPSHLYLCGHEYTVTHNSILGAIYIMLRTLAIEGHNSYILCGVGSQSIELFSKIEKLTYNAIPSFKTLTDIFQGEVVKSQANSNGFTHDPASYKFHLYNNSSVFTLNGAYDNNRSKYILIRTSLLRQSEMIG